MKDKSKKSTYSTTFGIDPTFWTVLLQSGGMDETRTRFATYLLLIYSGSASSPVVI